jgi:glucose/arabinose dehydrogenase
LPTRALLVVLAGFTVVLALVSEGQSQAGQPASTCFGLTPTRFGTFGNDTITGTSGPDVILARSGNDTVHGMGGADRICGNEGQDTLNGNGGNDMLAGGPRDDTVNGGFNNDTIQGNDGNDTLNGDPGNDNINGGNGTDDCDGGTGTNTITNCEDDPGETGIQLINAFPAQVSFTNPVDIDPVPNTTNDFVVSQNNGVIIRVTNGTPVQIGDLSTIVDTSGEGGLLNLAFSTNFATDNDVYVYYARDNGAGALEGQLSRFDLSDLDNPPGEVPILTVADIADPTNTNHNGGGLAFGGDGYIYLGVGDGGGQGDPSENGQDINVLAGKILRLDVEGVDPGDTDIIPDSNPFVGPTTGRDEIFAFGFRNPWRLSFDFANPNNLWIGDVGGSGWEEVNMINTASPAGRNYGWDDMEGFNCHEPSSGCQTTGRIVPVAVYAHGSSASISGGFVYRGTDIPSLVGQYIYGDFTRGEIRRTPATGSNQSVVLLTNPALGIVGFGQDFERELLVIDFNGGEIYRIVPAP